MRRGITVAAVLLLAACAAPPVPSSVSAVSAPSAAPDAGPLAAAPPRLVVERLVPAQELTRPAPPAMAAALRVELVADHCVDRDLAAPPAADPVLTILDRSYALPADEAPDNLVTAAAAGFSGASAAKLVRSVVVEDLAAMREAWEAAGLAITIESAYRSYASQAATFETWSARLGPAAALLRTARPGHSEHQLGTAIDVTSQGWSGRFGDWAAESAEGAWMAAHAWEYGFVMSYSAGAEDETCFGYEPWHYRWIGREAAAAQHAAGTPLRRFLERYAVP